GNRVVRAPEVGSGGTVRREDVDGVAQRSKQDAALEGEAVERRADAAQVPAVGRRQLESQYGAEHADAARAGQRCQARQGGPRAVSTPWGMRGIPGRAVPSRSVRSAADGHMRMPPAPISIGSTTRAAISAPRAATSCSNAPATSPATGSGRRATSNKWAANGS